MDIRYI